MKYLRLSYVVIVGMMLLTCRGWAQEDKVMKVTDDLQTVLSTLKQSVERLSVVNDQWTAKNNATKQQIAGLQAQLGRLEAQGDLLNKATAQLQDKNSRRDGQINRLQEEKSDLDNRIQQAQDSIKVTQQSLNAGYQEDQKLLLQLKGMTIALLPRPQLPTPESEAALRHEKEKLKLMKMIYDSQQRQEALHESILEFQKNTSLAPVAGAMAHQQLLKEQIKELESQMPVEPPQKLSAGYPNQWDNAQLYQLGLELKVLEKNYQQLKDLMEQMSKKAQNTQATVSQRIEQGKLQSGLDDLTHQGDNLKADLDDLRSQMVELDKRKSHLEMMIQHLP